MKKMALLICIICILTKLLVTNYAIAANHLIDLGNGILQVANKQERYYILTTSNEIYSMTNDGVLNHINSGLSAEHGIESIVVLDDGLYGYLNASKCIVQLLDDKDVPPKNPLQIPLPEELDLENGYIRSLQRQDNSICFIKYSYTSDESYLCNYDHTTQSLKMLKIQTNAFCPYRTGQVIMLIYTEGQPQLAALNWDTEDINIISQVPQNLTGLCYDEATDAIYYCIGNDLMRLSANTSTNIVSSISVGNALATSSLINSRYYIACDSNGYICLSDIQEPQQTTRLTILGESSSNIGYRSFINEHPEITVDISRSPYEYPAVEEFVQGLLSGSTDYDALRISTDYYDTSLLMEKGYCYDMSTYLPIVDYVESMFPVIAERVKHDGKLMAVPCSLKIANWEVYNPDAWVQANLSLEQVPETFIDFLQFFVEWQHVSEDIQDEFVPFEFYDVRAQLFEMMLKRYVALYDSQKIPLDFDSELFRTLLTKLDDTCNQFELRDDVYGMYLMNTGGEAMIKPILSLPLSSDTPPIVCGALDVYIVNPESPNKELAAEYIQTCLESLSIYEQALLFPIANQSIESDTYDSAMTDWQQEENRLNEALAAASEDHKAEIIAALDMHQSYKEYILDHRYLVTSDQMQLWQKAIVPTLYFPNPSLFYTNGGNGELLASVVQKYYANQINIDQLIFELNRIVWMIRQESL